jgi:hypothetical protein
MAYPVCAPEGLDTKGSETGWSTPSQQIGVLWPGLRRRAEALAFSLYQGSGMVWEAWNARSVGGDTSQWSSGRSASPWTTGLRNGTREMPECGEVISPCTPEIPMGPHGGGGGGGGGGFGPTPVTYHMPEQMCVIFFRFFLVSQTWSKGEQE